jgi:hypothetical protein
LSLYSGIWILYTTGSPSFPAWAYSNGIQIAAIVPRRRIEHDMITRGIIMELIGNVGFAKIGMFCARAI